MGKLVITTSDAFVANRYASSNEIHHFDASVSGDFVVSEWWYDNNTGFRITFVQFKMINLEADVSLSERGFGT